MGPRDSARLTIGDLAERTGVPPATLRSWEARYGFPRPVRLPSGHRRYAEADVTAVLELVRQRDSGLSLEVAVRRTASDTLGSESLYVELRRRHPELSPQLLAKPSLLALSRAIEDECCARAEEPLLFGGFQRGTWLRASYARWVELSRTARAAVVFAELPDPRPPVPGLPIEVPLPHESPLNREWIVLCDAPDLPACLVAVELLGEVGDRDAGRRFETVWTVDPATVRHASQVAGALADRYRPGWRHTDLQLEGDPPPASADLRRAQQLLDRVLAYLDAHVRAHQG